MFFQNWVFCETKQVIIPYRIKNCLLYNNIGKILKYNVVYVTMKPLYEIKGWN